MDPNSLIDKLPDAFPDTGVFPTWIQVHQDESNALDNDLETIQKSFQVANASGSDLDEIGKDFGRLGERTGRTDPVYRSFLQSLVRAYGGRGTVDDIKTAISAGTAVDESDISITEDFATLEYDVTLESGAWSQHDVSDLADFAELGDPAAVKLRNIQYEIASGVAVGTATDVTSTSIGTNRLSSADRPDISTTAGSTIS